MSRKHEIFKPIDPQNKVVKMYTCGPTVYNHTHIGNFRSFLMADLLRRTLELNGYQVKHVLNITDVGHMTDDSQLGDDGGEDRMETALKRKEGKHDGNHGVTHFKTPQEVAHFYTLSFLSDFKALNCLMPHVLPRATEHISDMIKIIESLLEKGYAYTAPSGSVYFDISQFPEYGKLSNNTLESLMTGAGGRVLNQDQKEKRNPQDFALWKKDETHLMKWETPLGVGFPGWHIECSAMSSRHLGNHFDIHTGGEDNKFPHHECEIAQSEAANGHTYVNYWVHCKHLMVNNEKMSKSKNNFFTIPQLINMGYSPAAIRWELLSAHYMGTLNFTKSGLRAAKKNIERLVDLKKILESRLSQSAMLDDFTSTQSTLENFRTDFTAALNANLNVPKAMAILSPFSVFAKEKASDPRLAQQALDILKEFDSILGVIWNYESVQMAPKSDIKEKVEELLRKRKEARDNRNYEKSDSIRQELLDLGIEISDSPNGTTWTFRS